MRIAVYTCDCSKSFRFRVDIARLLFQLQRLIEKRECLSEISDLRLEISQLVQRLCF